MYYYFMILIIVVLLFIPDDKNRFDFGRDIMSNSDTLSKYVLLN